jgi:hypothetical protein
VRVCVWSAGCLWAKETAATEAREFYCVFESAICICVWERQVLTNLPILIRYLLFCVQEASRLQKQKLADLDWTPWDTHIDPSLQNRTEFFAQESHKQNQAAISFEESVQSKSWRP